MDTLVNLIEDYEQVADVLIDLLQTVDVELLVNEMEDDSWQAVDPDVNQTAKRIEALKVIRRVMDRYFEIADADEVAE